MEVSAGSSTDKPASYMGLMDQLVLERLAPVGHAQVARAVLMVAYECLDEEPIHHGATTSFVQAPGTHFHPVSGSGYGPVPFPECSRAPMRPWSLREGNRARLTLMTALASSGTRITKQLLPSRIMWGWVAAPTGMLPSSSPKRSKTAIILQPDSDDMLTNLADSTDGPLLRYVLSRRARHLASTVLSSLYPRSVEGSP